MHFVKGLALQIGYTAPRVLPAESLASPARWFRGGCRHHVAATPMPSPNQTRNTGPRVSLRVLPMENLLTAT